MKCFVFQNAIWFPLECEPTYWQLASEPAFRNIGLLLVAIVGLGFAAYRSYHLYHQTKIGQKQSQTSEDGLNIDRFQKGAAMLGEKEDTVRAAGVFVLFELVDQNPKEYYEQVQKLLCIFIRYTSIEFLNNNENPSIQKYDGPPQACLVAFRTLTKVNTIRKKTHGLSRIDCRMIRLKNCIFDGEYFADISLEDAILEDGFFRNANFTEADISRSRFTCCNLSDSILVRTRFRNTDFRKTLFTDADCEGATFSNCKNLTYAQLSQAKNVDPEFLEELRLKELSEKETSNPEAAPPTIP